MEDLIKEEYYKKVLLPAHAKRRAEKLVNVLDVFINVEEKNERKPRIAEHFQRIFSNALDITTQVDVAGYKIASIFPIFDSPFKEEVMELAEDTIADEALQNESAKVELTLVPGFRIISLDGELPDKDVMVKHSYVLVRLENGESVR
jgi:hypothetical protein